MIDFNWDSFGELNAWQTILTICVIMLTLFVLGRFLFKFWPWLKRMIALTDALAQLPAFISRTDEAIAEIRHEVAFNNGSSVKDAIGRVEGEVAKLHTKFDELKAADAQLAYRLEQTAPKPVRRQNGSKG